MRYLIRLWIMDVLNLLIQLYLKIIFRREDSMINFWKTLKNWNNLLLKQQE